jgi:hypothetical protein
MHHDKERLKAGLLLAGAVGFAVLGQFYFANQRAYVWDAIIFFAIALICFAGLLTVVTRTVREKSPGSEPNWQARGQRMLGDRRTIPAALALLLNILAARSANANPPPSDYTLTVLFWLASLALFAGTFVSVPRLARGVRDGIRKTGHALRRDERFAAELTLVLGLVLIGLLLRAWDLEHIPRNLSGDEGTQGMWALDALEGRLRNPFATGWFTVPTMSFFAQAASLRLFGDSVAGLRTLSALIGTATLVFTYLLARRNLGRRVAFFALAALTFNHYHIHFSRLGSNQIADPLFMVLTLWLLTEGLRRTRGERKNTANNALHWFLAAGLVMGLSWYAYFGSRVILLVVAAFLGIQAVAERDFVQRHARALTLMALIGFMAFSPLLVYYVNYPENLTARFSQVNFFRWLENELNRPDHDSTLELIVRQVWRSVSAFNYTLDPTFWYHAQIPLLDFVSGILFILGLVIAVVQWRRPIMRLILLWFACAIVFGWILTENPPSSMRMVIIAPALALLIGLGLDRLLTLARWVMGGSREQWNWVGLTMLGLAALLNVYYYFIAYTPTRVYGNPTAESSTVLARYLRDQTMVRLTPPESDAASADNPQPFVYFYGPPFLYYDFGTIRFIARHIPGVNVPAPGEDPDFRTPVSGPTLFVVLHERLDELPAIQAHHPNGQLREFYSEADGRLMFVIYEVLW